MICANCGKEFLEKYSKYSNGQNCSKHCAKSFASKFNKEESKKKISETLKNKPIRETVCKLCGNPVYTKCTNTNVYCNACKQKINGKNRPYCNRCGAERGKCKHPKLCRKNIKLINTLEKYFGFDKTSFGSERYYEEIFRVKVMLEEDYFNNQKSVIEIAEKYNHPEATCLYGVFKSIDITVRNLKNAGLIAYKTGRNMVSLNDNGSIGKTGFHITWDNKKVWFRSSYEEDYAKELDKQKVKYEMETLRIGYFDTQKCIDRTAIPDFYLPETNTIVEIKGSYFYNEQNMKDKIKAYTKHGYNFKLILDHKEIV